MSESETLFQSAGSGSVPQGVGASTRPTTSTPSSNPFDDALASTGAAPAPFASTCLQTSAHRLPTTSTPNSNPSTHGPDASASMHPAAVHSGLDYSFCMPHGVQHEAVNAARAELLPAFAQPNTSAIGSSSLARQPGVAPPLPSTSPPPLPTSAPPRPVSTSATGTGGASCSGQAASAQAAHFHTTLFGGTVPFEVPEDSW